MPGRPVLEDKEADCSSLDEIFFMSPLRRAKPTSKPKPTHDPSLLADGRHLIERRNEALTVPFTQVSDAICRSLEDAEKTEGGPRRVLAKITSIAHQEAVKGVAAVFNPDAEENPNENLLECIRRVMVLEAVIHKSHSKGPMDKKGKGKVHELSPIPLRGTLKMKGGPGESIPAREQLDIQEYSNQAYWRFAPYLESVRCTLKPTCKCITDPFRSSGSNLRNYISLLPKELMMCRKSTFGSCAAPWKKPWSRTSWPPETSCLILETTNQPTTQAKFILPACGSCTSSVT